MTNLSLFDYERFKKMSTKELDELAREVRETIINTVAKKGGHLSSNLGVVELTIAIHHFFNLPTDRLLFDVGHQCYTHKLLTSRKEGFVESLRELGGISGYQKIDESEYDCFEAGHAATAISAAVGMAIARDLNHENYNVIAFVGDGSIVSGMSLEAINHLGALKDNKVIIILNDNEMSISSPVGIISAKLSKIHRHFTVGTTKSTYIRVTKALPFGKKIYRLSRTVKNRIKQFFMDKTIFESFNLGYLGPVDGHNIKELEKTFKTASKMDKSVVIHVITKKGRGYSYAENDRIGKWHGVEPFNVATGEKLNHKDPHITSWSALTSDIALNLGKSREDIVYITPAMVNGSAMNKIFETYPSRSFDVGIAEEHAVTMAAGLSLNNKCPYVAIYSTFLQRAYDQISHDICRMNLKSVFVVDRAGVVPNDGETHQGIFDVGIIKDLPNTIIAMPKDASDACMIYKTAFDQLQPFFIRIPKDDVVSQYDFDRIEKGTIGKWDYIQDEMAKINLIVTGPNYNKVANLIKNHKINANLIFARYYKPLDIDVLKQVLNNGLPTIVIDLYANESGLYSSIAIYMVKNKFFSTLIPFVIPNHYVTTGRVDELLKSFDRDFDSLLALIKELIKSEQ